ncbi:hypothetical protein ACGFXC_35425 [Streptomyces sp. NPDC048507]|uniref:hypothetical protein n=1 Tax=Streptomyces sp. NPDC048507 TaxID=3365560 RepID=UPI0037201546
MSGEQPDLDVSKAALAQIARGITDCLKELKELGPIGTASMGDGFTELKLSGLQSGHAGLTSQLDAFCERWSWGVRTLVQQANVSAAHVGLSAGMVHEQDQYVQGGFKVLANAVAGGSPYASEQEVADKDWGDVLSANPYTNLRDPDYGPGSLAESKENSDRAWKQTWEDIAPSRKDDGAKLAETLRERTEGQQP